MREYKLYFKKGKYFLSKHENICALKEFKKALSRCNHDNKNELAVVSYYIGITLKKMDLVNPAIQSWLLSQKLYKRSYPRKMIQRFVNEYGMCKQNIKTDNDRNAFFAYHLLKYLETKSTGKIGTDAEKHMIMELIEEYWQSLQKSGKLDNQDCQIKMQIIKSFKIPFPFFKVPEFLDENTIRIDFTRKKKADMLQKCFCGSGIPYGMCCGRIKEAEELRFGTF